MKIIFTTKIKKRILVIIILKQRPPNDTCPSLVKNFSAQISFSQTFSYKFILAFTTRLQYINAYNCNKFDY